MSHPTLDLRWSLRGSVTGAGDRVVLTIEHPRDGLSLKFMAFERLSAACDERATSSLGATKALEDERRNRCGYVLSVRQ